MISEKNGFLFVHIPKTGGNSIQDVLVDYSEDYKVIQGEHQDGDERFEIRNKKYDINKHTPLFKYKQKIPSGVYEGLFKFATIRNPWDRAVSLYFSPHSDREKFTHDKFVDVIGKMKPLSYYVKELSVYERIKTKIGVKISASSLCSDIDYLIRFENLSEEFKKVCNLLDLGDEKLPKKNTSDRKHYREYYNKETKEMIANKFTEEINVGKYNF